MKKFFVLLILICIAGGLTYFYLTKKGEIPELVFKEYISKINYEDYDSMYEMLSEDSRKAIAKEDFIKRNKNIYLRN